MLCKYVADLKGDSTLPGIKIFFHRQEPTATEESSYMYINIINKNADSKETIENVIVKLYTIMEINSHIKHLVVVGDGKTYDHIIQIKSKYKNMLDWLLPFPGDWHTMKNFAFMLIQIYGLNDLVHLFHKGKTANSILNVTSWDKTRSFLLQVF